MKKLWVWLCLVVLGLSMYMLGDSASAYSGSNYTSNSTLAKKIDNLINGNVAIFSNTDEKFPVGSRLSMSKTYAWQNGKFSGKQCYAYGNAAYYYLFGDVPYHGGGGYSNSRLISGVKGLKTLSYDVLVEAGVGCGAYIRTTTKSNGAYDGDNGHSMIVLTYDESSITTLHGNYDKNGLIAIEKVTWEKFNKTHISGRSRYVSHIVQPNSTAGSLSGYTKIDSTARIAVSTKAKTGNAADDQCYIKETPFEDGKTVDVIAKGGVINVVGAVKNKYDNTWYKTEDGNFVWSGDVKVYEIDWNELFNLSAKFTYNKAVSSHVVPYADSPDAGSVSKGQTVTVKKFLTNKPGNIWAQLSDNSFVCFYDKAKDETYMTFKAHVTQPAHDTTYPTGNITVTADQGFWLKGAVTADVPFLTVSTRIVDRQTGKDVTAVGSPVAVSPAATARKVELWVKNDSNCLDSRTLFRNLTQGWYRYELNVQFGFKYEGKVFKFGDEMNLVKSNFSVNNPSTEEPKEQTTPVSSPSHLTISVGETYSFTSVATGEVSWEFIQGGELLKIEEVNGEYTLCPIKEGIAIVEYTGADGSKAKMGITIMPYTMYREIYPEPSGDWSGIVTAGMNQSFKLYLLGPQDKYVSKPVWSVSDPSIANIVSVDDRICTVQATGNGTVMLRASVDILMEDGYLNPTETWTAELKLTMQSSSTEEPPMGDGVDRLPGDADSNGAVANNDVVTILRHIAGEKVSINLSNADVTGDGKVDTQDVLRIMQYLAGWNVTLQ